MESEYGDTYDEQGDMRGVFLDEDVGEEEGAEDSPEDRLEILVQRQAEQAINWRDEDLDHMQAKATDYYMGRPFGNEAEGRSRVVSTDVRDTIQAILPSLLRIFFGSEKTVEFEPRMPEDVPVAEQLTDMADIVIRNDNDGFLQIYGAMKDAMIRKLGIIKVYWEDEEKVEGYEYTGLTEQALTALQGEEGVEVEIHETYPVAAPGTPEGIMTLYDASVLRRHNDGRLRFVTVPPEEFIFSPEARDRETADMMGHVRHVPASDLIAMGIDKDLVEEHKGKVRYLNSGYALDTARRFDLDQREANHDEVDDEREDVWFGEIYTYADMSEEQDGTADLIKATVIGDNHELVDWEHCDERPFALFTCDPEPHTLIGLCTADYVMDVQLVKSSIMRGMLDSLTLALNPRTVVEEGEVNMGDVMNHEVGGVIRTTKDVNAVIREFAHRFDQSGGAAFPMLQYMDEQKENRTGISKAAAGLDADALQSATKAAVAATLSGAQQHIEMLARVFAETGMKQLYSLILKMLVKHQDQTRMVRLRNEWVEMDPAAWHADMDVRVNLALGAGSSEEKLQLMQLVLQNQEAQLQQGSPLVSYAEYRSTLGRMIEMAGWPNSDEFYKPWSEQEQAQYDQQKAQEPPQDPALMLAQAQIQIEQERLALDRQEMMMKDEREKLKMRMDFALDQAKAEAQYQTQINDAEIQADLQAGKAIIDAAQREAVARQAAQSQGAPNGGQGVSGGAGAGGGPTPQR